MAGGDLVRVHRFRPRVIRALYQAAKRSIFGHLDHFYAAKQMSVQPDEVLSQRLGTITMGVPLHRKDAPIARRGQP